MIVSYFVAPLICPNCGKVSPEDTSTNMQTHIVTDFNINILRVGDKLNIGIEEIEDSYIKIKAPEPNSSIVILETWDCPYDSTENWAKIVIEDWSIKEIVAVELSKPLLEQAHFISDFIVEWIKSRTGTSLFMEGALISNFSEVLRGQLK